MGRLSLPASGVVYADACVFIYVVERHPDYCRLLRPLWQASSAGHLVVVTGALALLEVLVLPMRNGDTALQADYEQGLSGALATCLAIDEPVLRQAAMLRATLPALRAPDAIHAATALLSGASCFITNDAKLRRVPGLPVTLLSDQL